MPDRTKVTIRLDEKRLERLDAMSRQEGVSRSRLMERAIDLLARQQVENSLREGYLAMADENRRTAEDLRHAMREVLE